MRTISGHSVETVWKNYLVSTISHRFLGTVDLGIDEFFGMDRASNTRLGLAYGITNDLTIGIGRSSQNKVYDGFLKYRAINQKENGMPITITFMGASQIETREWPEEQEAATNSRHRMSYTFQALMARKFSETFSFQVSPTIVHNNLVVESQESNTALALGFAARFQITPTTSIQSEYYRRLTQDDLVHRNARDVIGFAIDFNTVKHAFQLQFTNNTDITEADFLTNTTDDFFSKGIHFGFHITRRFGL